MSDLVQLRYVDDCCIEDTALRESASAIEGQHCSIRKFTYTDKSDMTTRVFSISLTGKMALMPKPPARARQ
jgi:hypothetical protein